MCYEYNYNNLIGAPHKNCQPNTQCMKCLEIQIQINEIIV